MARRSHKTPPQDDWHQRVLALEDGLLPGRGDRSPPADRQSGPPGPSGRITSPALTWVTGALFLGAGIVGILMGMA